MKEKITPCLWFNNNGREAAKLYCEQLRNAKVVSESPMVTEIEIDGQRLTLLDGGPMYQPNASISLFYVCENEEEINRIWTAFSDGGSVIMPLDKYDWSSRYGWVNDSFGISWQLAVGKLSDVGQRLTPCLLFSGKQHGRAEEAINHYARIFKDFSSDGILRYDAGDKPEKEGTVKHAQVSFNGQKFMFMDSARPDMPAFSEGVSLTIHCESQDEIDYYWSRLTENGSESMCGWLKDKFDVSWQVVPTMLNKLMEDPSKAGKAAKAFMQMRKLDIEKIVQATMA